MKTSTQIRKWLRIIHRDLGYLLVGITLVYGISGYLLNHMDGKDPAYKTVEEHMEFQPNLSVDELEKAWSNYGDLPPSKKITENEKGFYKIMLNGGIGVYNVNTGDLDYEFHKQRKFIYYINKFHYNRTKGWTFMADFFAFGLMFLAVSGMFIVPKKKGFMGRGKWFVLAGLLIPILWIIFTK
ncbi:MAG: PepSY-associated TM helix domain-containing protein [Bacteroidales bacterium]